MLVRASLMLSHVRLSTRRLSSSLAPTLSQDQQLVICLCKEGQLQDALSLFYSLESPPLLSQTYAALLHACARHASLSEGEALHRHMLANNVRPDLFVSNHLVNFYAKCGCMETAHRLFDEMPRRNLVSWTALISGYDQANRPDDCFQQFIHLLAHYLPNEFALASVLTSCASCANLNRGRQVFSCWVTQNAR